MPSKARTRKSSQKAAATKKSSRKESADSAFNLLGGQDERPAIERAAEAVAVACAANTRFVTVSGLNPLVVSPNNLFNRRFKEVGMTFDVQMESFRAVLIRLLPEIMGDLREMPLSPELVIGLVVDFVEASLLELAADSNA